MKKITNRIIILIILSISVALGISFYYNNHQTLYSELTESKKNNLISDLETNPIITNDNNKKISFKDQYPDTSQEIWLKSLKSDYILHVFERSNEYGKGVSFEIFEYKDNTVNKAITLYGYKGNYKDAIQLAQQLKIDILDLCKDGEVNCEKRPLTKSNLFESSFYVTKEYRISKIVQEKKYKEDYLKYCGVVDSGWFYVWSQSYYKKFSKAVTLDDLANCLRARGYGDENINSFAQDENGNKKTYKELFESTPPYQP